MSAPGRSLPHDHLAAFDLRGAAEGPGRSRRLRRALLTLGPLRQIRAAQLTAPKTEEAVRWLSRASPGGAGEWREGLPGRDCSAGFSSPDPGRGAHSPARLRPPGRLEEEGEGPGPAPLGRPGPAHTRAAPAVSKRRGR
ncbi:hypothetical protein J1605_014627 [Eschrichtius robustus]|uniref:Uncharacterized protein n=1 Tax=Eschrichtius robustus TaxID=9764 RepID=A0AB34GFU8_ESCRO|nr:hypothetical protein J1605_014627 [Eschrichtius robustus]